MASDRSNKLGRLLSSVQPSHMPAASYWNALLWMNLSKPSCDCALYRRVLKSKPCRIVELGVGDLTRAVRVIALAQRSHSDTIHYCGIDLFEARSEQPLMLKEAYRQLAPSGAKVRLVPGDLLPALARTANMLTASDLLIIDARVSPADLESVLQFLPRMLSPATAVARYELKNAQPCLRWIKPESFLPALRPAA